MRIPEDVIDKITETIDIVSIVGEYVNLKKTGKNYTGLCPFHTEKTPSFNVTPEKNAYYCFGCQNGGSAITFIMNIEGLSFPEAVKRLADKAGISIPESPADKNYRNTKPLEELYDRLTKSFSYILRNDPRGQTAREYLDSRNISAETTEAFALGYHPRQRNWLYQFLRNKNYTDDFLSKSGLFSAKKKDWSIFTDRLIFPIRNRMGKTIAFGGRKLSDFGPKYINSPETDIFKKGNTLYGLYISLQNIRKEDTFILVEGYTDVLALYQAGIRNCVAPLGTSFTENQAKLLKRYASNALLFFDGDEAGAKAALKAGYVCEDAGIHPQVVENEPNTDPADILKKHGSEMLKKRLKFRIFLFEYVLNRAVSQYGITTPDNKEKVTGAVFSYISRVDSEVRREEYLAKTADRLGVSVRSVINDFHSGSVKHSERNNTGKSSRGEEKPKKYKISTDLYLMFAAAVNREYFPYVRGAINTEDLQDPGAKMLFFALEECYRRDESSSAALLERIEDGVLRNMVSEKMVSQELKLNNELIIKSGVNEIKRRSLLKKKNRTIHRLNETLDSDQIHRLQEEIIFFDNELKKLEGIDDE
ncbi:MAG: DNA primase [Spirochaetia bacterium]